MRHTACVLLVFGCFMPASAGPAFPPFYARVTQVAYAGKGDTRRTQLRVWHDPKLRVTREETENGDTVWYRKRRLSCLAKGVLAPLSWCGLWLYMARFNDAGVHERVRVDPTGTRCETSTVEGSEPTELSPANFTRGGSGANGTEQWNLETASSDDGSKATRRYSLRTRTHPDGRSFVLPAEQTYSVQPGDGAAALQWSRSYCEVEVLASSGATFELPATCGGRGRAAAVARKLLDHKFELEPRAKLHLPYSSIPLWQKDSPQKDRAYHLHHVRNKRVNKVVRQANHFRAFSKKEHKKTGLCPMNVQFIDCPLGLNWSVMTGRK